MRILAVNFGHDAALALFEDGRLVEFEECERQSRIKHHHGLASSHIAAFLARCDLGFGDIDAAALCGTQGWGMPHDGLIELAPGWTAMHASLCGFDQRWDLAQYSTSDGAGDWYVKNSLVPQGLSRMSPSAGRKAFTFPFLGGASPDAGALRDLVLRASSLSRQEVSLQNAEFLCPYLMSVEGVSKPAFYVNHHACHAGYSHFYSGAENAILCTHDGPFPWEPFHSGGIYLSDSRSGVIPLVSHNLGLGFAYDHMAALAGVGEAGKLMGLASYAVPAPQVAETASAMLASFEAADPRACKAIIQNIFDRLPGEGQVRTSAMAAFAFAMADPSRAAQAAANIQHLVQQIFVSAIGAMASAIATARPDVACHDLTGGFALNCPSNTGLQQHCPGLKINPLPGSGDTGLAVGAGVLLNQHLGVSVERQIDSEGTIAAFPPSRIGHDALSGHDGLERIGVAQHEIPSFIAEALAAGKVLCLHRGRSEVGPRALGRRSIIAHAASAATRDRINAAKGREPWRPLAPICRREDYESYFDGTPDMGRFMLFTVRVLNDQIPAVTHADGTARVQCIGPDDEWLHPALGELKARGLAPIIINTSFNCAGEPLVETLDHAVRSFRRMGFDYLVTGRGIFRPIGTAA